MSETRVALVSGGSRGIGRAIAKALTGAGMRVAILYAGNKGAADEAVQNGDCALAIRCDVSLSGQVIEAVRQAKEALGPIDVLVNNAGITRDGLSMRMTDDDFQSVLSTNLSGAFYLIRAVMPDMVKRRAGRILNISSVSGLMGNAGQANYAASKAGMIGLTKSVAKELAPRGITVNAIAPGFIQTDMTGAMDAGALEKALEFVPMRRMGAPDDIAQAALFLCSEGAGYITGAVLQVDGGLYM